ncbi:Peptidase family M50 [Actinobacteria bacterium IMCC26207]|nr:Peptidase family M50 [Actinobacteria bacterium IMCC26207]
MSDSTSPEPDGSQAETSSQAGATVLVEPTEAEVQQERQDLAGVVGNPWSRGLRLVGLVAVVVLLGMRQGLSMLVVVAAIVIMIFLHELGHFIMARRAGMLVTEFFIGFGPRIFSFRRGETEYGLKVIPAGAYVKIIGMSNMEEVDPALESRTYRQKSCSQRVGVAVAGSTMHFLIAFVLLFIQFAFIGGPDGGRWQVGELTEGGAAQQAGVLTGDEVVGFNGSEISSFDEFRTQVSTADAGKVDFEVLRDGQRVVIPIDLSTRVKIIGTVGEDIDVLDNGDQILVGGSPANGAAAAAGLIEGSTLVQVNGVDVDSLDQVKSAMADSADGEFTLTTQSPDGVSNTATIDLGSEVATTQPTAFVGVGQQAVLETQSVPAAAWSSVTTFSRTAQASIVGVGKFFWPPNIYGFVSSTITGKAPEDSTTTATPAEDTPAGASANRPISIIGVAMLGRDLSSENISNLIQFLALLNIFIGIFNLIPLLPFDGGHVVIALYERFQEKRKRTDQRYLADVSRMAPVAYVVISVLAVVGILAMFLDITKGVSM